MTIAEEVASKWQGVQQVPPKGKETTYYADLLRRLMLSKKQLEETGRKYTILPDLRDLTRRTMVRIPAQHVPYLEVSVFDLISNPLKTHLQPAVSEFSTTGPDYELVSWFVRHAKKEPTLALDFKTLQAWVEKNKPVESNTPASAGEKSVDAENEKNKSDDAPSANPAPSASLASSADTTVPTPPPGESDGTNADRIYEHD